MDITVDSVFADFRGRRAALIKALTTDSDAFHRQCDPEKGNLCLYGYANGRWEVKLPVEQVPADMPEPILGINISRDKMHKKDWLSLVAVHCDSWLLASAFNFGARLPRGFNKADRQRLFTMINDLPTILEVLNEYAVQHPEEKPSVSNNNSNKSETGSNEPKDEGNDDEFSTMCGACKKRTSDDVWVCCNICKAWFHSRCVKVFLFNGVPIVPFECNSCIDM